MQNTVVKTLFSPDEFMQIQVTQREGLFRLAILLQYDTPEGKDYTPICGTGSSIFGTEQDATKEAERFLKKYEENPHLYR